MKLLRTWVIFSLCCFVMAKKKYLLVEIDDSKEQQQQQQQNGEDEGKGLNKPPPKVGGEKVENDFPRSTNQLEDRNEGLSNDDIGAPNVKLPQSQPQPQIGRNQGNIGPTKSPMIITTNLPKNLQGTNSPKSVKNYNLGKGKQQGNIQPVEILNSGNAKQPITTELPNKLPVSNSPKTTGNINLGKSKQPLTTALPNKLPVSSSTQSIYNLKLNNVKQPITTELYNKLPVSNSTESMDNLNLGNSKQPITTTIAKKFPVSNSPENMDNFNLGNSKQPITDLPTRVPVLNSPKNIGNPKQSLTDLPNKFPASNSPKFLKSQSLGNAERPTTEKMQVTNQPKNVKNQTLGNATEPIQRESSVPLPKQKKGGYRNLSPPRNAKNTPQKVKGVTKKQLSRNEKTAPKTVYQNQKVKGTNVPKKQNLLATPKMAQSKQTVKGNDVVRNLNPPAKTTPEKLPLSKAQQTSPAIKVAKGKQISEGKAKGNPVTKAAVQGLQQKNPTTKQQQQQIGPKAGVFLPTTTPSVKITPIKGASNVTAKPKGKSAGQTEKIQAISQKSNGTTSSPEGKSTQSLRKAFRKVHVEKTSTATTTFAEQEMKKHSTTKIPLLSTPLEQNGKIASSTGANDEDKEIKMTTPVNLTSPILKHKPIRAFNFLSNKERKKLAIKKKTLNRMKFANKTSSTKTTTESAAGGRKRTSTKPGEEITEYIYDMEDDVESSTQKDYTEIDDEEGETSTVTGFNPELNDAEETSTITGLNPEKDDDEEEEKGETSTITGLNPEIVTTTDKPEEIATKDETTAESSEEQQETPNKEGKNSTSGNNRTGKVSKYFEICIEDDIDLYGHDVTEKINISSAEECQKICQSNEKCQFFTWGTPQASGLRGKRCYLKGEGAESGRTRFKGLISGKKKC